MQVSSLSRQLARPPKAIAETLEGLKDADGKPKVHGIFAAVPYCIDLTRRHGAACW
jgi:molybdopterin adenylyltransferase